MTAPTSAIANLDAASTSTSAKSSAPYERSEVDDDVGEFNPSCKRLEGGDPTCGCVDFNAGGVARHYERDGYGPTCTGAELDVGGLDARISELVEGKSASTVRACA